LIKWLESPQQVKVQVEKNNWLWVGIIVFWLFERVSQSICCRTLNLGAFEFLNNTGDTVRAVGWSDGKGTGGSGSARNPHSKMVTVYSCEF
jgi:hypothetical protein